MTLTTPSRSARRARSSPTGARVVAHAALAPVGLAHVAGPRGAGRGAAPVEDWLDLRGELGRGHRHLPVAAQLALAAGRRALTLLGPSALGAVPPERRELMVASACGAAGTHARMDATILDEGAQLLSPLGAPHFSVNLLGAQLSAELVTHGAATTFTTTTTAVVDAVQAAAARLARGRCDLVLVVAVEHAAPLAHRPGAETGALALVLARPRPPTAAAGDVRGPRLRAVRGTWHDGGLRSALVAAVDDLSDGRAVVGDVTVLVDPRAATELTGARDDLPGDVRVRVGACGHGAFLPAAAVLDAVRRAGGGPRLVLAVGDGGRLAGVRVDPADGVDDAPDERGTGR